MNSTINTQKVILDTKKNTPAKKSEEQLSESEIKPKPCCACPETRRPRDQCIIEKGEENCQQLIQAHRECMAKYGFIV